MRRFRLLLLRCMLLKLGLVLRRLLLRRTLCLRMLLGLLLLLLLLQVLVVLLAAGLVEGRSSGFIPPERLAAINGLSPQRPCQVLGYTGPCFRCSKGP